MLSLKRLGRENSTLSALAGKLAQQVLAVTLGKSVILPRLIYNMKAAVRCIRALLRSAVGCSV